MWVWMSACRFSESYRNVQTQTCLPTSGVQRPFDCPMNRLYEETWSLQGQQPSYHLCDGDWKGTSTNFTQVCWQDKWVLMHVRRKSGIKPLWLQQCHSVSKLHYGWVRRLSNDGLGGQNEYKGQGWWEGSYTGLPLALHSGDQDLDLCEANSQWWPLYGSSWGEPWSS